MPKSHHRRELKWRQVSLILYTNLSSLRTIFPFGVIVKRTLVTGTRGELARELEPIEHYNLKCEDLVGAYDMCTIKPWSEKRSGSVYLLGENKLNAILKLPYVWFRAVSESQFSCALRSIQHIYSEYRDYTMLWGVTYRRLKQWKIIKLFPQFTVERWQCTRGFNDMTLNETILACWVGGSLLHNRF